MRYKATITVNAASGHQSKIVLPHVDTAEKANAFLASIESAYMTGKGTAVSITASSKIPAVIDGGNTDRRAIITYQDNTDDSVKRISIPSWGTDAGDSTLERDGERVPLVACQSVVEALQTASGRSLTAIEGWVIQGR